MTIVETVNIDKAKLRMALELANPDLEITPEAVDSLYEWCEYQIEIVRDILEGRMMPTLKDGQLQLYKYPKDLAALFGARLSLL